MVFFYRADGLNSYEVSAPSGHVGYVGLDSLPILGVDRGPNNMLRASPNNKINHRSTNLLKIDSKFNIQSYVSTLLVEHSASLSGRRAPRHHINTRRSINTDLINTQTKLHLISTRLLIHCPYSV